jgi:hypothetical protein
MAGMQATITVHAGITVIPGPVTLAERAARGEWWCECHGWHRHDVVRCPAEGNA